MPNLASIVLLLQTVLSLLSNPQLAQNAQVQSMASQAINLATQALQQPANTQLGAVPTSTVTYTIPTSTDNSQPIVINVVPPVQNIGAPDLGSVTTSTPSVPSSCTLIAKPTCISPNSPDCSGSIYTEKDGDYTWTSVGIPSSSIGQLIWVSASGYPVNKKLGNNIVQSNGEEILSYGPVFQGETEDFLLQFPNASCTTSWMGVNPDGSQFVPKN